MNKSKVSVLIDRTAIARNVMGPESWRRLKRLARVSYVETDKLAPKQMAAQIRDADAVLTSWGTPQLTKEYLDLAPNLRIIAHAAGSIRPVVSDEVWRRRIVVTSAAAAIAFNVADYTLGCLILGLRRFLANVEHVKEGRWGLDHESATMKSIRGARIGMVGAGFVGRSVIKLLKPFGAEIALYDPTLSKHDAAKLGVRKMELLEIAAWADAVTLHAPGIPATDRMIDAKFIAAMRPNTFLLNPARGRIIDETALYRRLKKGDISAVLDVTDPEPPSITNPLRKLKNVMITPHIAGAGDFAQLGAFAVTEIERVLGDLAPRYRITEKMLAKMA